jgi:predicted nucleic acid-binding protein
VDQLLRARLGRKPAHAFLAALASGEHSVAYLTAALLRAAVEFDRRFGGVDLGVVDAAVMAIADRHDLPILTFDFEDFRAAYPARGYWRLVVDEARHEDAVRT